MHAGMKLVEQTSTKKLLVKNGLTVAEAQNNRQDWFSLQQATMFGPDKLLGTSLGVKRDSQGKRLSPIDLFTRYCGYHLETVPSDRVYEWRSYTDSLLRQNHLAICPMHGETLHTSGGTCFNFEVVSPPPLSEPLGERKWWDIKLSCYIV